MFNTPAPPFCSYNQTSTPTTSRLYINSITKFLWPPPPIFFYNFGKKDNHRSIRDSTSTSGQKGWCLHQQAYHRMNTNKQWQRKAALHQFSKFLPKFMAAGGWRTLNLQFMSFLPHWCYMQNLVKICSVVHDKKLKFFNCERAMHGTRRRTDNHCNRSSE